MKLETLKQKMDAAHYIYDDTLATVLTVALQLGRPLLIEGAAGVGKTEVAKVMASALDRELVRLQCYEGWMKVRRCTNGTIRSSFCPFRSIWQARTGKS